VKDDACSFCRDQHKKGAAADYAAMAAGLRVAAEKHAVPKPVLMVEGQPLLPLAADGSHGDVRRVGHDIDHVWSNMLSLVDIGSGLWRFAGKEFVGQPGRRFFNDLEMMQLGNGDFVAEEGAAALARARAHMTMWAVMKSPLVLSTNLSTLGPDTLRVAMNPLALRANQDSLGAQARRIKSATPVGTANAAAADVADVVAVAAPCESGKMTQRWRWARAVDATDSTNGTLWTRDEAGRAWCLAMPTSGIWSVVPYTPGSLSHPTPCLDSGSTSSWRAELAGDDNDGVGEYAFIWRSGDRPYGFGWGQDAGSSGPLPHTRWLQTNRGGNWVGNLSAAEGMAGAVFSPAGPVIDNDGVGGVGTRPGAGFCLDLANGGNVETWVGPLEGGAAVAAVLNRSPLPQAATVSFAEAGVVGNTSRVGVRSAWGEAGTNRGGSYTCEVPARGAALLIFEPESSTREQLLSSSSSNKGSSASPPSPPSAEPPTGIWRASPPNPAVVGVPSMSE
jgi:hypothetical protein